MKKVLLLLICILFNYCSKTSINYSNEFNPILFYTKSKIEKSILENEYLKLPYNNIDSKQNEIALLKINHNIQFISYDGAISYMVIIDTIGGVESFYLLNTGPEHIINSTAEALKKSKFVSLMEDGTPIKSYIFVSYLFSSGKSRYPCINGKSTKPKEKLLKYDLPVKKRTDNKQEIIKRVAPRYSPSARQAKAEGTVVVSILVNNKGNVIDAEIFRTDHILLNEACLDAAMKLKFKPSSINYEYKHIYMNIPFNFRLGS